MLIKEQMELVKRAAGDLPMVLLVHIAEGYRIREKLIQVLGAGCAGLLVQSDWQLGDLAVRLNFGGVLVLNRPGLFRACFELVIGSIALVMFRAHGYLSSGRNWRESQSPIIPAQAKQKKRGARRGGRSAAINLETKRLGRLWGGRADQCAPDAEARANSDQEQRQQKPLAPRGGERAATALAGRRSGLDHHAVRRGFRHLMNLFADAYLKFPALAGQQQLVRAHQRDLGQGWLSRPGVDASFRGEQLKRFGLRRCEHGGAALEPGADPGCGL